MEKPSGAIWCLVLCLRKFALAAGASDQTPNLRISRQPAVHPIADATDFPGYFAVPTSQFNKMLGRAAWLVWHSEWKCMSVTVVVPNRRGTGELIRYVQPVNFPWLVVKCWQSALTHRITSRHTHYKKKKKSLAISESNTTCISSNTNDNICYCSTGSLCCSSGALVVKWNNSLLVNSCHVH